MSSSAGSGVGSDGSVSDGDSERTPHFLAESGTSESEGSEVGSEFPEIPSLDVSKDADGARVVDYGESAGPKNPLDELGDSSLDPRVVLDMMASRMKEAEKKRKKEPRYFWLQIGVEQHHVILTWILVLGTLSLFLVSAIVAIATPGPMPCTDVDCGFLMPLAVQILVAVVVLVSYGLLSIIAIAILLCPGVLLRQAFRLKAGALLCLFLMFWSTWMVVFPIVHRGHVVPYYRFNRYALDVSRIDDQAADVKVSYIYSDALAGQRIMLIVKKVSGGEKSIYDILPWHNEIYRDSGSEETIVSAPDFNRTVKVDGLDDGEYYAFIYSPTHEKTGSKIHPAYDPYEFKGTINFWADNSTNIHNAFLDRRIYKICQWSSTGLVPCRSLVH